ncbi:hypothetical protein [Corynebacterium antarcticum]|uniref:hypothetical protein n=1 Tax=Corynebacterium antarcticum TaxID=2800405 RepID=UPI002005816A|nr:hypothetical protein [Corynebacterium antarcticum]MCK7660048.1 hypothetical protein [Corynebacterium antarcticum]
MARYIPYVKPVFGPIANDADLHDLFAPEMVEWWLGQIQATARRAINDRKELKKCRIWAAPNPSEYAAANRNRDGQADFLYTPVEPLPRTVVILSSSQLADLNRRIRDLPAPRGRERAAMMLGLAFGAGLSHPERVAVTAGDIVPSGAWVRVGGERLPVREQARDLVASLAALNVSSASQNNESAAWGLTLTTPRASCGTRGQRRACSTVCPATCWQRV